MAWKYSQRDLEYYQIPDRIFWKVRLQSSDASLIARTPDSLGRSGIPFEIYKGTIFCCGHAGSNELACFKPEYCPTGFEICRRFFPALPMCYRCIVAWRSRKHTWFGRIVYPETQKLCYCLTLWTRHHPSARLGSAQLLMLWGELYQGHREEV
jgi:hypothetical protein